MQEQDAFDALGRCGKDVAERENPGVVYQYVYRDPFAPHGFPELRGGLRPCQVDLDDTHVAAVRGGTYFGSNGFQRFTAVARQHEVVAQRRQPQGIAAPDARPGARDERPGASRCDFSAFHQGRRFNSSTIFRGRSGHSLQHFMSTEYIRAMQ